LSLTEEIVCAFSLKQTITVLPRVVAEILTVIVVWEPEFAFCTLCTKLMPGGKEGETEGLTDGETLGEIDGLTEGDTDALGDCDGDMDGEILGEIEALGDSDGLMLGDIEGEIDGDIDADGDWDGETEGLIEGDTEGEAEPASKVSENETQPERVVSSPPSVRSAPDPPYQIVPVKLTVSVLTAL
jgi:hypothetical protein